MLTRLDLRGAPDPATCFAPRSGVRSAAADPGDRITDDVTAAVRVIVADVRARGDAALRELTARFDGWSGDELRVPARDLKRALESAAPAFRAALEHAAAEILAHHEAQRQPAVRRRSAGIEVEELVRPVDRAGLYVPGGRAAYPSTVLMTAIPARVAGVPEVALCVPAGPHGAVAPATLAAAALVGVDEVYRVGGAQAIAAMAYGTGTIAPVDVIAGPGNAYVTAAKREVYGVVGIDALAGPSEVVVVADATVPPEFVGADLVAQAEHGPGGRAVLVTWDAGLADSVAAAVGDSLGDAGSIVLVDDARAAMAVVNSIAPEHLELIADDAEALVPLVRHAGAVFVGPWSPAVVGDYVAGVNHILPTARTARFASALRVDTFRRHFHVVRVSRDGLDAVSEHVAALAAAEGLPAHARSIEVRRAGALAQEPT